MPIDIAVVKECIEKYLKDIHKIEDVATRLKISSETLKKDFVRHERIGLSRYLMTLRVERMKERLISTEEKCLSICLDLGLREDVGAKLFRKITGITMDEFRKRHGNGYNKHK